MKYHKVPALSMAVIHNHQIEWTKAYGWPDVDQQKPATPETRFLADSVSKSINGKGMLSCPDIGCQFSPKIDNLNQDKTVDPLSDPENKRSRTAKRPAAEPALALVRLSCLTIA